MDPNRLNKQILDNLSNMKSKLNYLNQTIDNLKSIGIKKIYCCDRNNLRRTIYSTNVLESGKKRKKEKTDRYWKGKPCPKKLRHLRKGKKLEKVKWYLRGHKLGPLRKIKVIRIIIWRRRKHASALYSSFNKHLFSNEKACNIFLNCIYKELRLLTVRSLSWAQ